MYWFVTAREIEMCNEIANHFGISVRDVIDNNKDREIMRGFKYGTQKLQKGKIVRPLPWRPPAHLMDEIGQPRLQGGRLGDMPPGTSSSDGGGSDFQSICWECKYGQHVKRKNGFKRCREQYGDAGMDWEMADLEARAHGLRGAGGGAEEGGQAVRRSASPGPSPGQGASVSDRLAVMVGESWVSTDSESYQASTCRRLNSGVWSWDIFLAPRVDRDAS